MKNEQVEITYELLRSKVLKGYAYRLLSSTPVENEKNKRSVNMYTGSGGALLMLDAFEKKKFPAALAGEAIEVQTDTAGYQPLNALTVIKVKKT